MFSVSKQAANEGLPARHQLDLVEEKHGPLPVAPLRVQAVVLLDEQLQIGRRSMPARRSSSKLKYSSPSRGVPAARRSANTCQSSVVLPARRGPITATALPLTQGIRTSRRVNAGGWTARLSLIFNRIKSRINPSHTDMQS